MSSCLSSAASSVPGQPLGLCCSHEMLFGALEPDRRLGPFFRVFLWLYLGLKLPQCGASQGLRHCPQTARCRRGCPQGVWLRSCPPRPCPPCCPLATGSALADCPASAPAEKPAPVSAGPSGAPLGAGLWLSCCLTPEVGSQASCFQGPVSDPQHLRR